MKYILFISAIIFLISCGNEEDSFPKSYTYSHMDQSQEGLFLLNTPENAISMALSTGLYGAYREEWKEQSAELMQVAFNLQEIELLTENTVRIHIITDEEELDTIVSYTMQDEEIIIEALSDTDIIYYDSENDEFVVCGFTMVALPGPNVLNPGPIYNQVIVEDCQEDGGLGDHLDYLLGNNDFVALDTIGLFITKLVYK